MFHWTNKVIPVWVWVNINGNFFHLWVNSSFKHTFLHVCSHLCVCASTPAVYSERLFEQQRSCFLYYLQYHPCLHDECARALLFDPINCASSGVSFNYRCNSCFCFAFFSYYSSQLECPWECFVTLFGNRVLYMPANVSPYAIMGGSDWPLLHLLRETFIEPGFLKKNLMAQIPKYTTREYRKTRLSIRFSLVLEQTIIHRIMSKYPFCWVYS